jgi:hypothetical protein
MERDNLKKYVPSPLWKGASSIYWGWRNRGRHVLAQSFNSRWQKSKRELSMYHNMHQGKRCFVIGNGPSLKKIDLSHLRDEYTFGVNRIYLLFPELGFTTTYLVSVNELVLEQCAEDIKALSLPKFITWRARKYYIEDPQVIFLDTDYTGPESFSPDMTKRIFEGFTVTYVALQLTFYMGFEEVILIGVDHSFATKGLPNTTVISLGDDPNHFTPGYFGKGFRWQLPDLEGSERAYSLARNAFARSNRKVLDATIDGKLTVFPKVSYESLF